MNESQKKAVSEAQKKRWAEKKKKEIVPLPEGVKVGERPDLFDLYRKGRGTGDKWIAYVQSLLAMDATKTLQIDLSSVGDTKKHVKAVVNGIRKTGELMGWKKQVKFALIGTILHVSI